MTQIWVIVLVVSSCTKNGVIILKLIDHMLQRCHFKYDWRIKLN